MHKLTFLFLVLPFALARSIPVIHPIIRIPTHAIILLNEIVLGQSPLNDTLIIRFIDFVVDIRCFSRLRGKRTREYRVLYFAW